MLVHEDDRGREAGSQGSTGLVPSEHERLREDQCSKRRTELIRHLDTDNIRGDPVLISSGPGGMDSGFVQYQTGCLTGQGLNSGGAMPAQ